jgi:hypothetical protein
MVRSSSPTVKNEGKGIVFQRSRGTGSAEDVFFCVDSRIVLVGGSIFLDSSSFRL